MLRRLVPMIAVSAALVFAAGACSDDAQDDVEDAVTSVSEAGDEVTDDAAEAAVRNLAATHGADQFEQAGHEIDGELTCESSVADGEDGVAVSCTGTTVDGEDATLEGVTSEMPGASVTELEGEFTGTVAGGEAFSVTSLGG